MTPRRRLGRWGGWFVLANTAFLALIGLRYLWHYSRLAPSTGWIYAVIAFLGHMGALACVPFLLLLPVMLLIPKPRIVVPLFVLLAGTVASLLALDASVFAESRYHLNVLTFAVPEPRIWMLLAVYFVLGLLVEAGLARWVWRHTAVPSTRHVGRYLALGLAACFLASHGIHAWAEAHSYVPVTAFTRYLPMYFPLKDSRRMARLGLVNEARAREYRIAAARGRPGDGGLR